jgi:hypothetical protein
MTYRTAALEASMKSLSKQDLSKKLSRVPAVSARLVLLLIILMSLSVSEVLYEIQQASASSHLGILGRPAPELNLDNWIDTDGKQRTPIQLSDNRGKVIYLYFFQDW